MSTSNNKSIGMGEILLVITIMFTVLKLAGVINWSWWLVILPLLIWPLIIVSTVIIICTILGLGGLLIFFIDYIENKSNRKNRKV